MTYNEALEKLNSKGRTYIDGDAKVLVIIAPSKTEDLEKFLKQLDIENYNDDDCIKFCTDDKYKFHEKRIDNNF